MQVKVSGQCGVRSMGCFSPRFQKVEFPYVCWGGGRNSSRVFTEVYLTSKSKPGVKPPVLVGMTITRVA